MSESPDTNSIPRDECDHRKCNAEGLVWLETEKSAILLCGHHMRALVIDPVTKRAAVIDISAYWKHTGLPFDLENFWSPTVEVEEEEELDDDEESEDEESDEAEEEIQEEEGEQ